MRIEEEQRNQRVLYVLSFACKEEWESVRGYILDAIADADVEERSCVFRYMGIMGKRMSEGSDGEWHSYLFSHEMCGFTKYLMLAVCSARRGRMPFWKGDASDVQHG